MAKGIVKGGLNDVGGGGIDPSDATAAAANIDAGLTAYVAIGKVTGTREAAAILAARANGLGGTVQDLFPVSVGISGQFPVRSIQPQGAAVDIKTLTQV